MGLGVSERVGESMWVYSEEQEEACKEHFDRVNAVVRQANGYHVAQCAVYEAYVDDGVHPRLTKQCDKETVH